MARTYLWPMELHCACAWSVNSATSTPSMSCGSKSSTAFYPSGEGRAGSGKIAATSGTPAFEKGGCHAHTQTDRTGLEHHSRSAVAGGLCSITRPSPCPCCWRCVSNGIRRTRGSSATLDGCASDARISESCYRGWLLLGHSGSLSARARGDEGRLGLCRRSYRNGSLRNGRVREDGPCRGRRSHVRSECDQLRGDPADLLLGCARPDTARSTRARHWAAIQVRHLPGERRSEERGGGLYRATHPGASGPCRERPSSCRPCMRGPPVTGLPLR